MPQHTWPFGHGFWIQVIASEVSVVLLTEVLSPKGFFLEQLTGSPVLTLELSKVYPAMTLWMWRQ